MPTPAKQLLGKTLDDGWRIAEFAPRLPHATGSTFSVGYIVVNDIGARAYLKALDLSDALKSPDPTSVLQAMTEAYNFERDLLRMCRDKRLDRVAMSISEGTIPADPVRNDIIPVPYLIFELADGDVRSHQALAVNIDLAWCLRSLHHMATGLWQLHSQHIAHQDLKPSNVLVFSESESKVSDLGRASSKGRQMRHDQTTIAGDPSYAPPELHYGFISSDWNGRRYGCDAYLLGSMVVFFFTQLSMTSLLFSELDDSMLPKNWKGTYAGVLPYLRDAFGRAVDQLKNSVPPGCVEEITIAVRQLCDPDLDLRGHPLTRAFKGNSFSLERYVSLFDLLARRRERIIRRTLK